MRHCLPSLMSRRRLLVQADGGVLAACGGALTSESEAGEVSPGVVASETAFPEAQVTTPTESGAEAGAPVEPAPDVLSASTGKDPAGHLNPVAGLSLRAPDAPAPSPPSAPPPVASPLTPGQAATLNIPATQPRRES